jgi:sulfate adenylyltransferase subunit 2
MVKVRFRTLGCYPITAAVESDAETLAEIVEEVFQVKLSERATRLMDGAAEESMEKKKIEGYF